MESLVSSKTSADSMTHSCPELELIIGGWWKNDPASLNGKVDEVKIYDQSLNSDEVNELSKFFQ